MITSASTSYVPRRPARISSAYAAKKASAVIVSGHSMALSHLFSRSPYMPRLWQCHRPSEDEELPQDHDGDDEDDDDGGDDHDRPHGHPRHREADEERKREQEDGDDPPE